MLSDRKEAADQEIEDTLAGCQERLLNTALSTSLNISHGEATLTSIFYLFLVAMLPAVQNSDLMSIMLCHCYLNKSGYF